MSQMKELPCPNCGGKIMFEPQLLVQGQSFYCNTCTASIGISNKSREQAKEAMNEFNKLKNQVKQSKS